MSTQALQAAILAGRATPIVFSAVAVPYLVGAGRSADDHIGNVTGVTSTGPIRQTMALIREILRRRGGVGSLWTPSEINSEYYMDLARESAAELGFEMIARPVTGPHGIQGVVQGLLNEKVDVLFPMSDNTINTAFDVIGRAADENGLPLFGSFLRSIVGACAALGFDFYDMGAKTGRIAVRVKNGESPARIPIQSMDEVRLYINTEAAAKQGVIFSKGLLDRVNKVVSVTFRPLDGPGFGPRLRSKVHRHPAAGTASRMAFPTRAIPSPQDSLSVRPSGQDHRGTAEDRKHPVPWTSLAKRSCSKSVNSRPS